MRAVCTFCHSSLIAHSTRVSILTQVDGIDHNQSCTIPDIGKQFQAERSAFHQGHVDGHSRLCPQSADGLCARFINRVQDVAQSCGRDVTTLNGKV